MSKARDLANFISTGALTDGSLDIADVDGLQAAIDDKLDTDGDGSSLTGIDSLPSQSGNADKVLTTNGSAASWADAAGGGNVAEFTASGTLPNGKPVILKADGTVEVVAESSASVSENIPESSEVVFDSSFSVTHSVAFLPNRDGVFLCCYTDYGNTSSIELVLGTISGSSLSFGTPVHAATDANHGSISFDPDSSSDDFILTYQSGTNNNDGLVSVGFVTGSAISVGSATTFSTNSVGQTAVAWNSGSSKALICYHDIYTNNGKAYVATISGTTISLGSAVTFYASQLDSSNTLPLVRMDDDVFVLGYKVDSSQTGYVVVGTISGTSVSFGTAVSVGSVKGDLEIASLSSSKFVVAQKGSSENGYVRVGTVSGTSISLGSSVNIGKVNQNIHVAASSSVPNKCIVSWDYQTNSNYGSVIVGTVSGTSISFGSIQTFNAATTWNICSAFDPNPNNAGNFVVCYRDGGNSNYGVARTGQIATTVTVTNLTESDYIGFSEAAYTDGQTASVMLKGGISATQSGLTVGSDYYVQGDGTLDTTADSVSVEAGKAVSATTLLLKGH